MSSEIAGKIFDYTEVSGGVKIDKFKDSGELQSYLAGQARAAAAAGEFKINKIGDLAVVEIGAGAFSPASGAANLADAGITKVSLPETITEIAGDAFAGTSGGGYIKLELPISVWSRLSADVKDSLESDTDTERIPGETELSILPSGWRDYTRTQWETWVRVTFPDLTPAEREALYIYIKAHLDELTQGGEEYWDLVIGTDVTPRDNGTSIGGCNYNAKASTDYGGGTHYKLGISYEAALLILTELFGEKTRWEERIRSGSDGGNGFAGTSSLSTLGTGDSWVILEICGSNSVSWGNRCYILEKWDGSQLTKIGWNKF
jgi:hypothetical protein